MGHRYQRGHLHLSTNHTGWRNYLVFQQGTVQGEHAKEFRPPASKPVSHEAGLKMTAARPWASKAPARMCTGTLNPSLQYSHNTTPPIIAG